MSRGQPPAVGATDPQEEPTSSASHFLDMLWSRYCPTCNTRRPMEDTECPSDGSVLRDLSIATCDSRDALLHASTFGSVFKNDNGKEDLPGDAPRMPRILGGKWRLDSLLGGGTFGWFFAATHVILGMQVGIKVLRRRFTRTVAGRRLFHEEAMRLSLLRHPGIIQVLDYGEEADQPYLVTELLTGRPLHQVMERGGLSLEQSVDVMRQVAEALIVAHDGVDTRGPLVHLDIKPEHIFLERIQGRWHVKVIDFGIAEIAVAPSGSGAGCEAGRPANRLTGTFPYMAPERWQGVVDPRCDIYSIGIVLYELVAGRKPFCARDPDLMRTMHEHVIPEAPSRVRGGARTSALKELDAIILKSLSKDPRDRPQSAGDLEKALRRWLARPRLSARQRVLRASVIPCSLLLGFGALSYYRPWEVVSIQSSAEVVLGRDSTAGIHAFVSGVGYHSATLKITDGRNVVPLPLGTVDSSGVIRAELPAFQDLRGALGLEGDGRQEKISAWVEVVGRFGKVLRSNAFDIILDDQPPVICKAWTELSTWAEGASDESSDSTLKLVKRRQSPSVTLQVDEGLKVTECTLNEDVPATKGSAVGDGHTIEFVVPADAHELLAVDLVDRAGNHTRKCWKLSWVDDQAPSLLSTRVHFTSSSTYELMLEWDGQPGPVAIDMEGFKTASVQPKQDGSVWKCKVPVTFDTEENGTPVAREVTVTTWAVAATQTGREFGRPDVFQVHYLKRELKISRRPGKSGRFPVFYVVDEDERPLDESFAWTLLQSWEGSSGADAILSREARGSELDVGREESRSGKHMFIVVARDRYGNASNPVSESLGHRIEPRIRISYPPNGQILKLHHATCPCSKSVAEGEEPLRFNVDAAYDYGDLRFSLFVGDPDTGVEVAQFERANGANECVVPRDALFPWLRAGKKNMLYIVARDASEMWELDAKGYVEMGLEYDAPLACAFVTSNANPLACSHGPIDIQVKASGPAVKEVRIHDVVARRKGNLFTAGVKINPVGTTFIEGRVLLANGCTEIIRQGYSMGPIPGQRYFLSLGAEGTELELVYHEDGFWYTRLSAWSEVLKSFRRARTSGRSITMDGTTWNHAEEAAIGLGRELQRKLGGPIRARLAKLLEVTAICASGLEGKGTGPHWEWLHREKGEELTIAEVAADGTPKAIPGYVETNDCPFRVVIPAVGESTFRIPQLALRSLPSR